jgi:hypothetical protein
MLNINEIGDVHNRIDQLVSHFCKGNKAAFGRGADIQSGVLAGIIGGRKNKPSFDVLQKLLIAYPTVEPNWLLFGRGQMLKGKSTVPEESDKHYIGYVGQYPILSGKDNVTVPIIAGRYNRAKWDYLRRNLTPSPDEIEKEQPFDSMSLPKSLLTEGSHIIFPVYGNTMEPTFTEGDLLLFRQVDKSKARWGKEPEEHPTALDFIDKLPVYAIEFWGTHERSIEIGRFTFDDETGMLRCYYDNRSWHTPSESVTTVKEVWEFRWLISPRSENMASKQQQVINQLHKDLRQANQVINNLLEQLPAQGSQQENESSASSEKVPNMKEPHVSARQKKPATK